VLSSSTAVIGMAARKDAVTSAAVAATGRFATCQLGNTAMGSPATWRNLHRSATSAPEKLCVHTHAHAYTQHTHAHCLARSVARALSHNVWILALFSPAAPPCVRKGTTQHSRNFVFWFRPIDSRGSSTVLQERLARFCVAAPTC